MGHPEEDKNTFTPLLRYGSSYRQKGLDCKEIKEITQPAFKKVRQWRIVIISYTIRKALRPEWERNLFQHFCDLVFGTPIRGLEVILWDPAVPEYGEELMELRQTFLPLTILRNVGNLTIREAALDEFPPPRHNSRFSQRNGKLLLADPDKSNLLDKKLYKKLKHLAEGNGPVERHLINFVLSFDNFAPWKLELRNMGEDTIAVAHIGNAPFCGQEKSFNLNPYMAYQRSFLEKALRKAAKASLNFDSMGFKSVRADIVKHLQPQYNRIANASRVLVAAIEEDKDRYRALDLVPRGGYFQTFEAARLVILIEKYAAAFERDQDGRTEIAFRVDKREIKSFRMDHPREIMLRRPGRAFEHERYDLFIDAFKDLLCDLQAHFSEIKETRRDLFKSDTHGNTMYRTEYDPLGSLITSYLVMNWYIQPGVNCH
ncbi:hypothetical protein BHYA_0007g00700 [Botrytis hyacinthi]|uniref:Uncharacterized protein n=1 Tax=Botrytis hyacinthi TaxID=278943 RepID=A0A4Z1H6S2_9HELO|nr:hypothetical protein BHYA_0007g00700 [Botrytis hyacinthi]